MITLERANQILELIGSDYRAEEHQSQDRFFSELVGCLLDRIEALEARVSELESGVVKEELVISGGDMALGRFIQEINDRDGRILPDATVGHGQSGEGE